MQRQDGYPTRIGVEHGTSMLPMIHFAANLHRAFQTVTPHGLKA